MKNFNELRKQNNKFIYKSYEIFKSEVDISLVFNYELIDDNKTVLFIHKLILKKNNQIDLDMPLDNIVFHIGLIEAINYYKIAAPQEFIIKCGYINKDQISWFKKLYYNGLGEFLYLNNISISMDDLVDFKVDNSYKKFEYISVDTKDNNIIPIGGGKDSLVTYELLKDKFSDSFMFSINPIKASQNILDNHKENSIILSRVLDPQILEFNKKGYLNGHIPFSSIVGFISIWLGLIYKTKYIVLSNESSANEENVIFNGLKVNHQYSKSLEFEDDLRYYIDKYITKDVEYFSFLRPLDEINIAKLFSKQKQHFFTFLSCNVGSRKNIWCSNCPKCLFTYIMLCNFIEDDILHKIFGKDLFEDIDLLETFNKLSQETEVKPFECVGTYDEVNYAIQRKIKQYNDKPLPKLLEEYIKTEQKKQNYDFVIDYKNGNNLPNKFLEILKKNVM